MSRGFDLFISSEMNTMKIAIRIVAVVSMMVPGMVNAQAPKVTYDEHVLPILKEHCIACHSADKKKGDLQLHNYTSLVQGGSSGAAIKPGDGENSLLYRVMAHKAEPLMPPSKPKLPDATAEVIKKWIDGGALENSGSKPAVVKPKNDIERVSITRGKPSGPPPMPPLTLSLSPFVQAQRPTAVTAIAASPWAPLVAVGGQKQVFLYHSDTLELLGILPFPEGVPYVLKFSRNASLLLAGGGRGGKSGKVVVWKVATGERILEVGDELDAVLAADISPDQKQIALGGPSKVVRIYSTVDSKLMFEIKKHTDWIYGLEYSPDGVMLASADRNGGVSVWEKDTAREFSSMRGHTGAVLSVSWRNDSNVLATASEDTTIRLWDVENGNAIRSWGGHGGGSQWVEYDRTNRLLSTGRDKTTKIWNEQGQLTRGLDPFADVGLRCVFSHDGNRIIGGDWTGKVNVWNVSDGKLVGTLSQNPPSLAEQLELAAKELVAKVAARDQALAVLKASQAAANQANAELAAAQKAMTDADAAVKTAAANLVAAQANLQKANAAIPVIQGQINAKTILVTALTEAAAKVKAEADKKKDDAALAANAAQAATIVQTVTNELAVLKKQLETAMAEVQTATSQVTTATQADATAKANLANAPKLVEAKKAALAPATAKLTTDQTALDQANAAVKAASERLDRCKNALTAEKK